MSLDDCHLVSGHSLPDGLEEAIPLEPTDLTTVLLQRVESWRQVTTLVKNYCEAHQVMYSNMARDYERIAKTVMDVPKFDAVEQPGEHAQTDEDYIGVSGAFLTLRAKSEAMINAANEAEKSLKLSAIPHVERLSHDIKEHYKELKTKGFKGSKDVMAARQQSQKQIELLGQYTSSFGMINFKSDPTKDPYVIHRQAMNKIDDQILKENIRADSLIALQKNLRTFEAHIIGGIQQTFNLLDQTQTAFWDVERECYSSVMTAFGAITTEAEWKNFLDLNKELLIDENAPKRSIDRIYFPNMDHESTLPLIEGVIQRKSTRTLSKQYNSGYYVVTPSKYLHQFASMDYVQSPDPEFSLYLPDCLLGPAYSQESGKFKFKITGKDSLKTLTTKHTFEFKTSSYNDLQKWWGVINEAVNAGVGAPVLSPRGTMDSATAAAAAVAVSGAPAMETESEPEVNETAIPANDIPVAGSVLGTPATEIPEIVPDVSDVSAHMEHDELASPVSSRADPPIGEGEISEVEHEVEPDKAPPVVA
ncbi:hypothetical protein V1511DRAFT_502979 [Dipodascopsis uninucleata]